MYCVFYLHSTFLLLHNVVSYFKENNCMVIEQVYEILNAPLLRSLGCISPRMVSTTLYRNTVLQQLL